MYLPLLHHNSKTHTVHKCCHFTCGIAHYQSPLSFIGFIPIPDVQSILYFILYKADQYPPSRKTQRPPLPGLLIYDLTIDLFSLSGRMFVSQPVLQRDTTHCSLPHPGLFISLFSPSFISSSCREQILKPTP